MEDITNFLQSSIFDIKVENLLIAFVIFVVCIFLRAFFSKVVLSFLKILASRTTTDIDDKIINALEPPFKFSFILLGIYLSEKVLGTTRYDLFLKNFISSMIIFITFWVFFRLINEFNTIFSLFTIDGKKALNDDIENFIIKSSKVLIFILGFLMFLQSWGVNITTFVASLGIGGLAFALAAKDATANLFGSIVIFADRPFKVGDWIELEGVEGTVEEIGVRSTRIRTFPRAQVTIPNAVVANAKIANWTRRSRRRSKSYIGLTYSTTSEQIKNIIEQVQDLLELRNDIHNDSIAVNFESFGENSLNILCHYHTRTTSWKEFLEIQQAVNISIMKIVEKNGSSFAFPSRSIYIEENKTNKATIDKLDIISEK